MAIDGEIGDEYLDAHLGDYRSDDHNFNSPNYLLWRSMGSRYQFASARARCGILSRTCLTPAGSLRTARRERNGAGYCNVHMGPAADVIGMVDGDETYAMYRALRTGLPSIFARHPGRAFETEPLQRRKSNILARYCYSREGASRARMMAVRSWGLVGCGIHGIFS
jgi:hypothetical protein